MKAYIARAMSGLPAEEVVANAKADKELLEKCGITVLCPVTAEKVKPSKKPIQSTKKVMDVYWHRDKQMIREADVLFNMSPHMPSLGVIREHGYARYHLWKKVISVFPEGRMPKEGAVCFYEDDFVTDSLLIAAGEALRTHGTYWQRLKWRVALFNRCFVRSFLFRLQEWLPERTK